MRYPVEFIHEDNDTITVVVPDLPGTHSFGDDEADALRHVVNAIESMLAAIIAAREDIPRPSKAGRRRTVAVPALTIAKIGIYEAMREAGIGKAELARRLGLHLPQVDRILDPRHNSHLDAVEAALAAVGRTLEVRVHEAA
ncbi:MAG: type II toxin-antitoxin system HicB family antitoxin [Bauldia sp.]|jgi:antitoxin HicB